MHREVEAGEHMDDPLVLLYVPCGSGEEAVRIASELLDKRLIACANIYASRSLYHWQGALADETEHVLICKTLASRSVEAHSVIKQAHSYDVPCILTFNPARANDEFYRWATGEVREAASPDVTAR